MQQVAARAGAQFVLVEPRTWKGGAPKGVTSLRVFDELDDAERALCEIPGAALRKLRAGRGVASGTGSDVLDAIGIGLWKLGRLRSARRTR